MELDWTKKCVICKKMCGRGSNALSTHVLTHGISLESYYKTYVNPSVKNSCEVCKKHTQFSPRFKKFNRFCTRKCQSIFISNRPEQKKLMRSVMAETIGRLNEDEEWKRRRSVIAKRTIADPNNKFGKKKELKV